MMYISAHLVAMPLLQFSVVNAYPVQNLTNLARNDMPPIVLGEHANHRTIVVVFCMSYAFLLALAQGKKVSCSGPLQSVHYSVDNIMKAIELAAWLAARQALGSLTFLCLHRASSVQPSSLLLVSTPLDWGSPPMRNAMRRYECVLLCMELRRLRCKSVTSRACIRISLISIQVPVPS